jgi:hypothetical protein
LKGAKIGVPFAKGGYSEKFRVFFEKTFLHLMKGITFALAFRKGLFFLKRACSLKVNSHFEMPVEKK